MIYTYNKLVRDKIPEEINKMKGRKAKYRIMDDNEYTKELNKKLNQTLIIATHNLDIAKQADRILELKDGKIILDKRNA